VFVKIWKNIDSYNETKGRFTLGSHIARNTSIDKLRSKILTTARKTFLQIISVNHFEDTNKLGDKMD
jgi:RNA polymerase sigma-70 factor (ECF subfamily)